MAVRKRRGRKHPGVYLMAPKLEQRIGWRARYRDHDTGKLVRVSLPAELTTAEQREAWCIEKSKELAKLKANGTERVASVTLAAAVADYFETVQSRLRSSTLALYRAAVDDFVSWAERASVRKTTDLTEARLHGYRDYLLARPRAGYAVGNGRGRASRVPSAARLSAQSVNLKLRAIKTALTWLRRRGQLRISSDAIADGLKPASVPREPPTFLRPAECRQLLQAAIYHDSETYVLTRDERRGDEKRHAGTTARFRDIGPFVLFVLLSGCRVSEGLNLRWADCDLDALDGEGRPAGEFRLQAAATKTNIGRVVSLDVTPVLRDLLVALKGRAEEGDPYVFGGARPMHRALAEKCARRMIFEFGAPKFSFQTLRRTCSTVSSNAPSLWGSASAFVAAKRLGHSPEVASRLYAGLTAVPKDAKTLEVAMGIEPLAVEIVRHARADFA